MADTHLLERRARGIEAVAAVRVERVPVTRRPSYKAYRLLQAGFVVLPILTGFDKFFHLLTNWDMYLANPVERMLPVSTPSFMLLVGVIEMAAGVLVAVVPRIGAFVVSAWLMGIVVNLLMPPGFYDLALRDFGLSLAACGLGLLAREYGRPIWEAWRTP